MRFGVGLYGIVAGLVQCSIGQFNSNSEYADYRDEEMIGKGRCIVCL